jgi:hypothetical protein
MDHPKIKETGEYIKNITSSQDKIIATKAVAYYAQRKFFGNDENKPPISNLSLSFIKSYLLLSYKTKNMDNSFFYGGTYLSGVNPPMPPKEKLDNATLVVLYYPLNDLSLELKIGPYYLYRLK